MIVECNSCQTRFQLDEGRIPPQGIRVRCSRCKEAFFLKHPSASSADAVDEIAQSSATGGGFLSPDATQDLTVESQLPSSRTSPSMSSPGLPAEVDGASFSGSEFEEAEESDWEFIDDQPAGKTAGGDRAGGRRTPSKPGVSDSEEVAVAEAAATPSGSPFRAEDVDKPAKPTKAAGRRAASVASAGSEKKRTKARDSLFGAGDSDGGAPPQPAVDRRGVGAPRPGAAEVSGPDGSAGSRTEVHPAVSARESVFGSVDDFSSLASEDPEVDQGSESPAIQEATERSLELTPKGDLGEPEEWDFFSDESLEKIGSAEGVAVGALTKDSTSESWSPATGSFGPGFDACSVGVLPGSKARDWVARVGRALGWVVTMGLLTVGVARGLLQGFHRDSRIPTTVDLGDFRAEGIRGRWVDTARSGVLYTVTGRLRNTTSTPAATGARLQVSLLGPKGERLESPGSSAGIPIEEAELRELPLNQVLALQEQGARALSVKSIEPGAAVSFSASLYEVPDEAARFVLELRPFQPPSREAPHEAGSGAAPDAQPLSEAPSSEEGGVRSDDGA